MQLMTYHLLSLNKKLIACMLLMAYVSPTAVNAQIGSEQVSASSRNVSEIKETNQPLAKRLPAKTNLATQIPPTVAPVLDNNLFCTQSDDSYPLIIDNDQEDVLFSEEKWEEIPDTPGTTFIHTGAVFPVSIASSLNSKTAHPGDPVLANLKVDLHIGGQLVAARGSNVLGHVYVVRPARCMLAAEISPKRWLRANGSIGIRFDEIITGSGEHLPLVAAPAQSARIVKNQAEGRILGINSNGEIVSPLSSQLKAQALHLVIRGAASAGGIFTMGAIPVAYGVLGAVNPSFAFLHPVGKNVPHRRLKGFCMGVVSGLPGGFLIADAVIKGVEANIKPGDEFLAEFKQDFTGEASSDASLIPGTNTKVHGEILPQKKH